MSGCASTMAVRPYCGVSSYDPLVHVIISAVKARQEDYLGTTFRVACSLFGVSKQRPKSAYYSAEGIEPHCTLQGCTTRCQRTASAAATWAGYSPTQSQMPICASWARYRQQTATLTLTPIWASSACP